MDTRLASLRDQASRGRPVSLGVDEHAVLLDSHAAALELADAVTQVLSIEQIAPSAVRPAHADESFSAWEIRNRFRRRIEEAKLRLRAALAKFRAASGGTK
jgi:hypothetical protein